MIQRFRFGLPLPTDSVVQEIPVSAGPVPFLTAEEDEIGRASCRERV